MKNNRKNRKLTIISVRNSMRQLKCAGLISRFKVKPLRSLYDPVKVLAVPTVAASYITVNLGYMGFEPEPILSSTDKGVAVRERSGFINLPQPA
jgi:hypothetical protein